AAPPFATNVGLGSRPRGRFPCAALPSPSYGVGLSGQFVNTSWLSPPSDLATHLLGSLPPDLSVLTVYFDVPANMGLVNPVGQHRFPVPSWVCVAPATY